MEDPIIETTPTNVTRRLARKNPIPHSGAVIRRAALVQVGYYDADRRNLFDYDLWIRLAKSGHQLGHIGLLRIAKRYHAGQKFALSKGYARASLMMQYRAIMAVDPDYRNFLNLALRVVTESVRGLRRAMNDFRDTSRQNSPTR